MTKRKVRVIAPVVELERLNVAAATPEGDLYAWTWTGELKAGGDGVFSGLQLPKWAWTLSGTPIPFEQFEGAMVNITIARVLDG